MRWMSELSIRTATRTDLGTDVATLEAAGVEFIPKNGGGLGVRLRNPLP